MKKRFIFERVETEDIVANSEEEARVLLAGLVLFEEEYELIDVWSAEEDDEGMCSHETSAE